MKAREPELEVIGKRFFRFHGTNSAAVHLQITLIRFRGIAGLVREWRKGAPGETFMMSSNTRLGHKVDGNRCGREVLELAIRKDLFADAAQAVAELDASGDGMGRQVLRSPRWALEFARDVWARAHERGKD